MYIYIHMCKYVYIYIYVCLFLHKHIYICILHKDTSIYVCIFFGIFLPKNREIAFEWSRI